jgi:hypothetical protein
METYWSSALHQEWSGSACRVHTQHDHLSFRLSRQGERDDLRVPGWLKQVMATIHDLVNGPKWNTDQAIVPLLLGYPYQNQPTVGVGHCRDRCDHLTRVLALVLDGQSFLRSLVDQGLHAVEGHLGRWAPEQGGHGGHGDNTTPSTIHFEAPAARFTREWSA